MQASTVSPTAASIRQRWRKRLGWGSAVVLVLLGIVTWPVYQFHVHERELREALAEADRLDPGWRFDDLEAARAKVPDAENAALRVQAAYRLLPPRWGSAPPPGWKVGLDETLDELAANEPLEEKLVVELRETLKQASAALAAARRLADLPRGRYAVAWREDLIGTLMPHLEQVRVVSRLLFLDAVLRTNDGDNEGAMRSCQAALNACRSVGDEPAIGSQLCRMSWGRPVRGLERVLAMGEPSGPSLEKLQHLLEQEMSQPSALLAARAERAMTYQFLEVVRGRKLDRRTWGLANPYGMPDTAVNWMEAARANACEAAYLRFLNQLVETMKLPPAERAEQLQGLQRPNRNVPFKALLGQFDEKRLCQQLLKAESQLACARAALAVERYRQDHGRWPQTLRDLMPIYLHSLQDPFDGSPLHYAPVEDGVLISGAESRVSFRLWDARKRKR